MLSTSQYQTSLFNVPESALKMDDSEEMFGKTPADANIGYGDETNDSTPGYGYGASASAPTNSDAITAERALINQLIMGAGGTSSLPGEQTVAHPSHHSSSIQDIIGLASVVPSQALTNHQMGMHGDHLGSMYSSQYQQPMPPAAATATAMMPQQSNQHHQYGDVFDLATRGNYGQSSGYTTAGYPTPFSNSSTLTDSMMRDELNQVLASRQAAAQHMTNHQAPAAAQHMTDSLFPSHSSAGTQPMTSYAPSYQNSLASLGQYQQNSNYSSQACATSGFGASNIEDYIAQMQNSTADSSALNMNYTVGTTSSHFGVVPSYPDNFPVNFATGLSSATRVPSYSQLSASAASSGRNTTTSSTKLNSSSASSSPILPDLSSGARQNHTIVDYPTSLAISTDETFLDPVQNFLRTRCIEVFVARKEDMMCPGKGSRANKLDQVGLRCFFCKDVPRKIRARQAICYPTKRETIFESVRNYHRVHFQACECIPKETKLEFKRLLDTDNPKRKSQRFVKAYYAVAASELGLAEDPKGLIFGAPPNNTGTQSKMLMSIIRAADSPDYAAKFWKSYSSNSAKDKALELRKFEHLATEKTREAIRQARRERTAFVYPQDFPAVSDLEFLLYSQGKQKRLIELFEQLYNTLLTCRLPPLLNYDM